jgi:hypothetical protein
MALFSAGLSLVLLATSGLHLWWAIRGVSPASVALPSRDGRPVFVPTRTATSLVAAGLAAAAVVAASRGALLGPMFRATTRGPSVALGLVFLARAIGDFRYVGFFKRVRGSRFAALDTRFFSPFSLLIGFAFLALSQTSPPTVR